MQRNSAVYYLTVISLSLAFVLRWLDSTSKRGYIRSMNILHTCCQHEQAMAWKDEPEQDSAEWQLQSSSFEHNRTQLQR